MPFPTLRQCVSVLFVLFFAALITGFAESPSPAYKHDLYRAERGSGQLIRDTFLGAELGGASTLFARHSAASVLVGAADFDGNGVADLLHFNASTGTLEVTFYAGAYQATRLNSTFLVTPGAGWTPKAVADFNRDGQPGVLFVNDRTRDAEIYFYGGPQGSTLLHQENLSSSIPLGWSVIGAADVNRDGHPDLILQNSSTRQVMVSYLSNATITSNALLGGSGLQGWTAIGMEDVNRDGHLDLIYTNDTTGQVMVSYYGGDRGLTFLTSAYLDSTSAPGWDAVVPAALTPMVSSGGPGPLTTNSSAATSSSTASSTSAILLFVGTGTSSGDVSAVKSLLTSLGMAFTSVTSSQLNSMTVSQLTAHKLFIMPGGDAVTIGKYLTKTATANVRQAIGNGLHYLGFCAGGFFAGNSIYNRLQMTGVIYKFFSAYYKGIAKEAVNITLSGGTKYDVYWQDGPQLSGWGSIVAKYPDGTAAITEGKYGSGFAILSGVHPEAPASWRYGMNFTTPLSVDLAYAGTLVKAALSGTALPHY